jgi:hypothetical protein
MTTIVGYTHPETALSVGLAIFTSHFELRERTIGKFNMFFKNK